MDADDAVRIYTGDCRAVLRGFWDESVDAVVTDPPYAEVDRPYGRLSEVEWFALMKEVVCQARRVLKPSGPAVFVLQANSEKVGKLRPWLFDFQAWLCREWGIVQDVYWWNTAAVPNVHTHRTIGLMRPSVKACVWAGPPDCYRDQAAVLWDESAANVAKRVVDRARTIAPYYSPSGGITNTGRMVGVAEERGGVTPFNLIPCPNTNSVSSGGACGHGAATPLNLCSWWVRYICPPGGTVLDPFGGSGTTALAALEQGRRCVLVEKEHAYVEIARRRLAGVTKPGTSKTSA